jgi:hypothetical protein
MQVGILFRTWDCGTGVGGVWAGGPSDEIVYHEALGVGKNNCEMHREKR